MQSRLSAALADPAARTNIAEVIAGPDPNGNPPDYLSAADDLIDGVSTGDLLFLTSDFLTLSEAAAPEIPDFKLHPSDLPTMHALVVFERPVRMAMLEDRIDSVSAVTWITYAQQPDNDGPGDGVLIAIWVDPRDLPEYSPDLVYPPLIPVHAARWYFGEHWKRAEHVIRWPAFLGTIFRLFQEGYVRDERRPVDRAERRRRQRSGQPIPEGIRILDIRSSAPTGAPQGSSDVEWTHRWLVRGHWRDQWYPSQGRHAPRWIRAHVKGPADKPLVARPTVYRADDRPEPPAVDDQVESGR